MLWVCDVQLSCRNPALVQQNNSAEWFELDKPGDTLGFQSGTTQQLLAREGKGQERLGQAEADWLFQCRKEMWTKLGLD